MIVVMEWNKEINHHQYLLQHIYQPFSNTPASFKTATSNKSEYQRVVQKDDNDYDFAKCATTTGKGYGISDLHSIKVHHGHK